MNRILDENIIEDGQIKKKHLSLIAWIQKDIRMISFILMICCILPLFPNIALLIQSASITNPLLPSYLFTLILLTSCLRCLIILISFVLAFVAYKKQKVKWIVLSIIILMFYFLYISYLDPFVEEWIQNIWRR